jgi:hypothetical protein
VLEEVLTQTEKILRADIEGHPQNRE